MRKSSKVEATKMYSALWSNPFYNSSDIDANRPMNFCVEVSLKEDQLLRGRKELVVDFLRYVLQHVGSCDIKVHSCAFRAGLLGARIGE